MGERRDAVKTPVSAEAMVSAMSVAWWRYFHAPPIPDAVRLLVAQWALETGWGRSMVCFNVGNVKAFSTTSDYDYCYFTTWEIVSADAARDMVRANPATAKIVRFVNDGRKAHVALYPDHPGCRFKAFASLEDGCLEHMGLIAERFSRSWPALRSGSAKEYARALKAQGYYTASVEEYETAIDGVARSLRRLPVAFDVPPADVTVGTGKPGLSSEAASEFLGLPRSE